MKKNKKILILVNDLSFFVSHRLPIAEVLLIKEFDVIIGYGELGRANLKSLEQKGIKLQHIPMYRGGINPLKDFKTIFYIWKFFKKEKPDIAHLVTIKPYLYGGIISRLTSVPSVVSAVTGLGSLFISKDFKMRFLRFLLHPIYKLTFNHFNQIVIMQNQDDQKELVDWGVVNITKIKLLKGSGVKLEDFKNPDEPKGTPVICFAARLLREKGVFEFISAALLLKKRGVKANFYLAGELDIKNPSGLNFDELNKIKEEKFIKVLGYKKDIAKLYAESNIVCLPSYREGFPKSLIEAAAASRAVVTTDVPGCRDAIIPDKTGLLVPVKDHRKLADALEWLIENPKERKNMAKAARKFAENEFSIEKIVESHLDIYQKLQNNIQ